nr:uncharacterized protein LOC100660845 [Loxodonta africana]
MYAMLANKLEFEQPVKSFMAVTGGGKRKLYGRFLAKLETFFLARIPDCLSLLQPRRLLTSARILNSFASPAQAVSALALSRVGASAPLSLLLFQSSSEPEFQVLNEDQSCGQVPGSLSFDDFRESRATTLQKFPESRMSKPLGKLFLYTGVFTSGTCTLMYYLIQKMFSKALYYQLALEHLYSHPESLEALGPPVNIHYLHLTDRFNFVDITEAQVLRGSSSRAVPQRQAPSAAL